VRVRPARALLRYRGHAAYEAADPARLAEAAGLFVGTRDFAAFANNAPGQDPRDRDTVRTVTAAAVVDEGGGDYRLSIELDGALRPAARKPGTRAEAGA